MADVLTTLTPEFREKIEDVIHRCAVNGFELHPYCGLRNCREQATLFRKSRTIEEIRIKAQSLRDRGASELADILISVGPQDGVLGQHVTKAAPGESWHQYAVAVDCVPLIGGKALWENSAKEWQIFGSVAASVGLMWAGTWSTFKEFPHVQLPSGNNPLTRFDSVELALAAMRKVGAL